MSVAQEAIASCRGHRTSPAAAVTHIIHESGTLRTVQEQKNLLYSIFFPCPAVRLSTVQALLRAAVQRPPGNRSARLSARIPLPFESVAYEKSSRTAERQRLHAGGWTGKHDRSAAAPGAFVTTHPAGGAGHRRLAGSVMAREMPQTIANSKSPASAPPGPTLTAITASGSSVWRQSVVTPLITA